MERSHSVFEATVPQAVSVPVPAADGFQPSEEQLHAIEEMIANRSTNFFLTGGAGTGKSYVISELRRRIGCCVCATTARAALNVGGTTIDRVFHMNREDYSVRNYASLSKTMREIADTIVIDEASMIGLKMANFVEDIATSFNKRIIKVGDLAQASPVKDEWGTRSNLFKSSNLIILRECHRQADGEYLKALGKLRHGEVGDEVRALFESRAVGERLMDPEFDKHVRMYATNKQAADYNSMRFENLDNGSPETRCMAEFVDTRDAYLASKYPVYDSVVTAALDATRLANNEWFKIGARVLFTVNDSSFRWVNGDTGEILDIMYNDNGTLKAFSANMNGRQIQSVKVSHFVVRRDRDGRVIEVDRARQEVKDPRGRPAYAVIGFPMRLGWGLTIHKSQGMTLDKAFVNIESILAMPGESRHGLAYVALSRTRELAGLAIEKWNDDAVYCSDEVKPFL